MRTPFNEDSTLKYLQESWIANETEITSNNIEEASEHLKNIVINPENIIRTESGNRQVVRLLVKDEQGQDSYIEVSIPSEQMRGNRISSKFLSTVITAFNRGNWAKGHRVYDKAVGNNPEDYPTNKLKEKDIQLLGKDTNLPKYSKYADLVGTGVKINPSSEPKKAVITNPNGEATVVNVNGAPHYLVGFEMRDQEQAFRVSGEGTPVVVATMPVPMTSIGSDGLIDPSYVKEFVSKWNSGKRYVWDGKEGHVETVEDPRGSQLSIEELGEKLVDLDRFKPEFKQGEVGTQGADVQKHRLQNVSQKKLIDDKDIAKAEKANGKPFTRKEFIEYVKNKGLIPPDALKKDEFGMKLFRRWKQNNPRLASYIKSRKKAMGQFQADKDRFETPEQGKERMAQAHDAEEIIIDDSDLMDIPDEIWATSDA
jgi:hypothetical protein